MFRWGRKAGFVIVAPLIGWGTLSGLAHAEVIPAVCNATNGQSVYQFEGSLVANPSAGGDYFKVSADSGEFHSNGVDEPLDAKNNYVFSIHDWTSGSTL